MIVGDRASKISRRNCSKTSELRFQVAERLTLLGLDRFAGKLAPNELIDARSRYASMALTACPNQWLSTSTTSTYCPDTRTILMSLH